MPPPPHQKPENVLKRANELIGVNQAPAALTLLHEHITSKRSRNVAITSLEPVMLLLVDLSVEQKKGKLAKDALYSYKNMSQNTNIATIELVLKRFIELAVAKVTSAQAKADEIQLSIDANATSGEANIDDLEATETPESIMLATVSGEQSRDRTDRAIVTPWLKFLWEAYRTVLDILRNNARLETLYQSTAAQAFDFCLKYSRKTEFRRLCELLRNHVQTAAKYSSQMHAINLNDPETLQRHLETRFQQLNVAVELELWQEAFRSVEDIHTLLNLSKRPPKNIMMANYYEKLTRIFLVGENYLFHAAAWSRYFTLLRQSSIVVSIGQGKKADNPPVGEADIQRAASFVLLAALAIPVISTSRSRGAMVDFDEAKKNKNSRLTHLLGMAQAPTRAGLFRDAMSKSMLKRALPEIRELYNILEVDFHPLSICKKISPILSKIGEDEEMAKYIQPLQQVILTRLFQQLSQVYDTVDLDFVQKLANFPEPYQVSRSTIEKFIMNGNKKGDLAIRMNHATGVLSFDNDVFSSAKATHSGSSAGSAESEGAIQRLQSTPSDIIRSQLTRLAKSLYTTCYYIDPEFSQARIAARDAALKRAREGAEAEHLEVLSRRDVIQKRNDAAFEQQAKKDKEAATQKRLLEQQLQEAEARRLATEQREREERRMKAERDRVRREEVQKQLADLNIAPDALEELGDLDNVDSNDIRRLKLVQLEREKNDISQKMRVTAKRLDHLERAFRKMEAKKLSADYEAQIKSDTDAYERFKAQTLAEAEEKHKLSVELKNRLGRIMPYYEEFRASLHERRRDEFERRRRDAERELERQITARKKEYREKKLREKREREQKERELHEAEEKAAREKEERERRAAAEREEMHRLREQRIREREEMAEKAAMQQRREEEAMARRKQAAAEVASPVEGRRPAGQPLLTRTNVPGGSWREREANKAAAEATVPADSPQTERRMPMRPAAGPRDEAHPSGRPRLNLQSRTINDTPKPETNNSSWRAKEAASSESWSASSARGGQRGGAPLSRDGSSRTATPIAASDPAVKPLSTGGAGKWVPSRRREAGN
ncbi:hypothetical protein BROUX41_003829 [Berkeleyomyces rouxiae]|uniref:uncharacterized protein n=1 Tax=Berkeleyomyces rouxiae TaxID=2035830 RepID=UPI003B7EC113